MTRFALPALALSLTLPLAACGGGDDAEPGIFEQVGQLAEAAEGMQEMGERIEEMAEQPPADPVDFRRLKELLPEELAGMARTSSEGQKQGMGGFNVSMANAEYGADPAAVTVTLTDLGGAQAAMLFGAAWTMVDMDKETDTGFERTTEIAGNPGYEKYDSGSERGEMQAIVADRFLVKVEGRSVTEDQLRGVMTALDFDALDDMRDEGRPDA